ncbi:MAG: thiamine-phosphate kinase [Candidatus Omnitrophota bacterium]
MGSALNKVKEINIINMISRQVKPKDKDVVVSIGDDTAVVAGRGDTYLLYTCDMLVERVHFKKDEDLKKVGFKAMAVSISDIAAMGGEPKHALISVGLPSAKAQEKARQLFAGIKACARKYHVDIIGGDTNRSKNIIIDVFMTGTVKRKHLVLRSGAKRGDYIFVSGPLGGTLAGKHLDFKPRLDAAHFLVKNFHVTSMMDLSDGLSMDLNRLCQASGTGAFVFEEKIPKNSGVLKVEPALFDGEDFELLFTLTPKESLKLLRQCQRRKTRLMFYPIGKMTDLFEGVRLVRKNGRIENLKPQGFKHF